MKTLNIQQLASIKSTMTGKSISHHQDELMKLFTEGNWDTNLLIVDLIETQADIINQLKQQVYALQKQVYDINWQG